jgi:hypothetical protein
VQDVDNIRVPDVREPMRDQDRGRPTLPVPDRLEQRIFRPRVQGRGRLIHDDELGIAEEATRRRDALPLPA